MTFSAPRAAVRVARRNIARNRGRSVLIALLVLLPVAAMVAAIAILRTTSPTRADYDTARLGRADLVGYAPSEEELRKYLPDGSVVEPLLQAQASLVLVGARPTVSLRGMQLDGLALGIVTITEGRAPLGPSEAAISQPVADLADIGIGGTVTLDGRSPMTVVGLVENPRYLAERMVVVDPASVAVETESAQWLVDVPMGVDPDAVASALYGDMGPGVPGIGLESRNVGLIPGSFDSFSPTVLVFGGLALLEAALIASAAFTVSIRRRQRELGLLAAVGATTRQLAATVLAEAALIGAAACAGGVALGVALAVAVDPWLDDLTGHRNQDLLIDASGLVGPIAIGFVAVLIAAIAPARTVARVPVLRALSGRRPPEASARGTLLLGGLFIAVALAMTGAGTATTEGFSSSAVLLLMGGAVIGTLGLGACSPWLLERLGVLANRLPLPGRLAFRDTARARSRSSPIVTAILSALTALVAIGGYAASTLASERQNWYPSLYPDQIVLFGADPKSAGQALLAEDGVIAGTTISTLVREDPDDAYLSFELTDARNPDGSLVNVLDSCGNCFEDAFEPRSVNDVAAGTPELLALARLEDAAADLRAGRIVILTTEPYTLTTVTVKEQFSDGEELVTRVLMTLPARIMRVPVSSGWLPDAFVPDSVIAELGLVPSNEGFDEPFVVQYDHPVTDEDFARARQIAGQYADTAAEIGTEPPSQQGQGFRFLILALVILFAVSVTGIAIALGEAESRPEQRTLLALGADPGLRRRIAASRAAILALLAGLLAVPAGMLPVWGLFSRDDYYTVAVPVLEIVGVLVVLPAVAIVSGYLLSRPIPDWNAFRSTRSGE
jgi:putative ABC transport system permease protein